MQNYAKTYQSQTLKPKPNSKAKAKLAKMLELFNIGEIRKF